MSDMPDELQSDELRKHQLQQEIKNVREDLGETVAALAYRTDVKARTGDKVQAAKESVATRAQSLKAGLSRNGGTDTDSPHVDGALVPAPARRRRKVQRSGMIAAIALGALGVLIWRRRG